MDWEWNPDIHLNTDVNILMCIAGHDREVWKLFSVLSKELCKTFNPLSYEMQFRKIRIFNVCGVYKEEYILDKQIHRTDGPALIIKGKDWEEKIWYYKGLRHRDGDKPAYKCDGEFIWYKYGKMHRDNGWAYRNDQRVMWYKEDVCHRIDGPAIVDVVDGNKWYIHGKEYTEEEFTKAVALETFTNF
jgi:hypothetical protein